MSASGALLECLYGSDVPRRLVKLVDLTLSMDDLVDFKLNPVLNSDESRTTRLALAGTGERDAWIQRVAKVWNSPAIATFWGAAPRHARHMVDTDGSRTYVVYNDDLQPPPGPLLAMTLSLPKIGPGLILRTPGPPEQLTEPIAGGVQALCSAGVQGQWALRTEQEASTGALWVSESRWRGDAAKTTEMVLGLPMASGWLARWKAIQQAGFNPYPDAVEFRMDGTVDLTVGFLPTTS